MRNMIFSACFFAAAVSSVSALTVEFDGCIGNSGTTDNPVRTAELCRNGRWKNQQSQLRPYYDAKEKLIYMSAGDTILNAYTIDGRLHKTYNMPSACIPGFNGGVVTRGGDNLYFVKDNAMQQLALNAPDGTSTTNANCSLKNIMIQSSHERNGEIVVMLEDRTLHLWNYKTGESREWGRVDPIKGERFISGIDWDLNGNLYVFTSGVAHKIVDGKVVDSREVIGIWYTICSIQRAGDIFIGVDWNGGLLRVNGKTLALEPGVAGGVSREIGGNSGAIHLEGDYYAVGGVRGNIAIVKWEAKLGKFVQQRTIGATRVANDLNVFNDGRIIANGGVYQWNAGESDGQSEELPYENHSLGPIASVRCGDDIVSAGISHAQPSFQTRLFDTRRVIQKACDKLFSKKFDGGIGIVFGGEKNEFVYFLCNDGRCTRFRYSHYYASVSEETEIELKLSVPCTNITGIAECANDEFIVAANGRIVFVKPEGNALREVGALKGSCSAQCRVAADKNYFVVSERDKNRVTIFNAKKQKVKEIKVPNPDRLAINGSYLVVHCVDDQRILKFRLHE